MCLCLCEYFFDLTNENTFELLDTVGKDSYHVRFMFLHYDKGFLIYALIQNRYHDSFKNPSMKHVVYYLV